MAQHQKHIFPFLWIKGEEQARVKEEIDRIKASGIDEFVVESRRHPHFLEDQWWADFGSILAYAKSKQMRLWLLDDAHFPTGYANGAVKKNPALRKDYLYYSAVDIYSEGYELTLNLELMRKPKRKWSDRQRSDAYEKSIETNEILSITAYPLLYDNLVSEHFRDLTFLKGSKLAQYRFPVGRWRVFVVYKTKENGGEADYINMLDKQSVQLLIDEIYERHYHHFRDDFGKTFRGFFSDEPGFGNTTGFSRDEIIGQKDMALPWSSEVCACLEKDKGLLPLLWHASDEQGKMAAIRLKYMNLITDLYSQNFTQTLGAWCRDRQVEYIGHVIEDNNMHARLGTGAGHYFKAMTGQTMAGIDIIGSQITVGGEETFRTNSSQNDGTFYHYCLPKLADSSAQLEAEKANQAFCELYGAYGWQLSIRNMKWILDSLFVRGITHFVPHAFSMEAFPDLDSPPHFYANGRNPQFPLFQELMSYMGKLSNVLAGGKVEAKVAILYHAELEWLGKSMKIQEPSKRLSQHQIDFLYVPSNWLSDTTVTASGFALNDHHFERFIIPASDSIPKAVYEFIGQLPKTSVLFIGHYPKGYVDTEGLHKVGLEDFPLVSLEDLPTHCEAYRQMTVCDTTEAKLAVRRQKKGEDEWLLLHNESLKSTYKVELPQRSSQFLYEYDVQTATYHKVEKGKQAILPYQLSVFLLTDSELESTDKDFPRLTQKLPFEDEWQVSLYAPDGHYKGGFSTLILDNIASRYPTFSGTISYKNVFRLEKMAMCRLRIDRVFDGCQILLNGQKIASLIAPPYQTTLRKGLRLGLNEVIIHVSTTADRQLIGEKLLIHQFEPMDPIGIIGQVELTAVEGSSCLEGE